MEIWTQNYTPIMNSEVVSALIAGIPLSLLFYMFAVRRSAFFKLSHWLTPLRDPINLCRSF